VTCEGGFDVSLSQTNEKLGVNIEAINAPAPYPDGRVGARFLRRTM
jgi:hypothetical protein